MTAANECPNGHTANTNDNCFDENCPYSNNKRHDGIERPEATG